MKFPTHAPNVNDHRAATKIPWCPLRHRGPAPNVNDHRAATHQPLVAARKVHWTSKTLPGDHFSRYGHCQRPRCLLCSSSPTPHCLPGMSVPPPEPCPFPVVPTQAPRAMRPTSTTTAPQPRSRGARLGSARDLSRPPSAPSWHRAAPAQGRPRWSPGASSARQCGARPEQRAAERRAARAASSSPTPQCLPGMSVPPPEPCPFPVVPTQAPRASAKRQRLPRG